MTVTDNILYILDDYVGRALKATRSTATVEQKIETEMLKMFKTVEAEVLAVLRQNEMLNVEQTISPFKQNKDKIAEATFQQIKNEFNISLVSYTTVRSEIEKTVKLFLGRLEREVITVIQDGISGSLQVSEVMSQLKTLLPEKARYEIERFVRSETLTRRNEEDMKARIQDGIRYHQWLTYMDGRERDSHAEQHELIVRVGERFPNGQRFPGDRSVDIGEWINCRCRLKDIILDVDQTAPIGKSWFYESEIVRVA